MEVTSDVSSVATIWPAVATYKTPVQNSNRRIVVIRGRRASQAGENGQLSWVLTRILKPLFALRLEATRRDFLPLTRSHSPPPGPRVTQAFTLARSQQSTEKQAMEPPTSKSSRTTSFTAFRVPAAATAFPDGPPSMSLSDRDTSSSSSPAFTGLTASLGALDVALRKSHTPARPVPAGVYLRSQSTKHGDVMTPPTPKGSRTSTGSTSFTVFQVPAAASTVPDTLPTVSLGDRGTSSSSTSSISGLNISLASLDDALQTHTGRGHRGSFTTTSTRFPVVGVTNSNSSGSGSSEARGGISWMRTGRVIRVKDSGASFRFPLEPDHLPRVQPTPEQIAVLKTRALALAEQSVASTYLWMENPTLSPELKKQSWKVHLEKKNCVIYRQRGSDTSRKAIVRAKLESSLEELAYAFNSDTTDDLRTANAHCYQGTFLDAAVLHVDESASFEDPFRFVGIKWFAFQSLVDSVYSVRDALMFEYTQTFIDARGQKVLVRVSQSVNLADVNGSEHPFGFIRSDATYVYLFRSVGPGSGAVDASLLVTLQFESRTTPAWLANKIVSGLGPTMMRLATCADAKYIVKNRLLTTKAWVPNSERPSCSMCFKSFNLLRSRHHCRTCAEVMCSTCTMELTLLTSRLPAALQPETGANIITSAEKFCLKCINQQRQERRHALVTLRSAAQSARAAAAMAFAASNDYRDSDAAVLDAGRESLSDADAMQYYGWGGIGPPQLSRKPSQLDDDARFVSGRATAPGTDWPRGRPHSYGSAFERRRQGSDASASSGYSDGSSSSVESRWERREKETSTSGLVLLEEASEADVVSVTPIPTSFVKMEESIAAQQALLRNMIREGQKIMQHTHQQQYYSGRPPPAPPSIAIESRPQLLALPPSSMIVDID